MKIWHISDLHIRQMTRDNEKVQKCLQDIWAQFGQDDILVVAGDVTDDGSARQYKRAANLLSRFKGKIILAPGNHDFGWLGNFFTWRAYRRWGKFVKEMDGNTVTNTKYKFIVVDSCLHTGSPHDFAQGRVGWYQRQKLKLKLWSTKLKPIVVFHHDIYCQDWVLQLKDDAKVMRLLIGKATYVLFGHSHEERERWWPDPASLHPPQTTFHSAGKLINLKTHEIYKIDTSKD
jgi:3',5'-cyclic AMP phosphodiesterase CpdA